MSGSAEAQGVDIYSWRHVREEAQHDRNFLLILWTDVGSMNFDYLGIHPTQGI